MRRSATNTAAARATLGPSSGTSRRASTRCVPMRNTSTPTRDHAPADDEHDDGRVLVDLRREHAEGPDGQTGPEQPQRAGAQMPRQALGGAPAGTRDRGALLALRACTPVSCRGMGVAIVGSTVRDVVHMPGCAPVHSTGGSPLFAARALSALGVRPGVATRCDDAALAAPIAELARSVLPEARRHGRAERAPLPARR